MMEGEESEGRRRRRRRTADGGCMARWLDGPSMLRPRCRSPVVVRPFVSCLVSSHMHGRRVLFPPPPSPFPSLLSPGGETVDADVESGACTPRKKKKSLSPSAGGAGWRRYRSRGCHSLVEDVHTPIEGRRLGASRFGGRGELCSVCCCAVSINDPHDVTRTCASAAVAKRGRAAKRRTARPRSTSAGAGTSRSTGRERASAEQARSRARRNTRVIPSGAPCRDGRGRD